MKSRLVTILALSAALISARAAQPSALSFKPIADDARAYVDTTTVVHGKMLTPADWRTLLRTGFEVPDGTLANCTATLVGPRVVLTAAHCADAGGKHGEVRPAFIEVNGVFIQMNCRMHPKYAAAPPTLDHSAPRSSADYALCLVTKDLSTTDEFTTVEYEDVDPKTALLAHAHILVTGDGCTSLTVRNGKLVPGSFDFLLRAADSLVNRVPTLSGADANYLVALSGTNDEPALCPGDSGGPLLTGATYADPKHARRIVALNSTVTASGPTYTQLESRFAALATGDFRTFVTAWLSDNHNPTICGVNKLPGTWPCRA